jgi:hypothetical protein
MQVLLLGNKISTIELALGNGSNSHPEQLPRGAPEERER